MMNYSKMALAALIGVALLQPKPVSASTLAYELIEDIDGDVANMTTRDLRRTRNSVVENNDGTIVAENLVSSDFGLNTSNDVTYRHLLTWLAPPAASFISAVLTIRAYDVEGGNDVVFADTFNLGALLSGAGSVTTTVFSGITLLSNIVDGNLNIVIDKDNTGPTEFHLNVLSSQLDVEYNEVPPPPAVPEPATLVLLGMGVVGAIRRRSRAVA